MLTEKFVSTTDLLLHQEIIKTTTMKNRLILSTSLVAKMLTVIVSQLNRYMAILGMAVMVTMVWRTQIRDWRWKGNQSTPCSQD